MISCDFEIKYDNSQVIHPDYTVYAFKVKVALSLPMQHFNET